MRAAILLVGQYALFRHAIGRILPPGRFQVVASVETIEDATNDSARGRSAVLDDPHGRRGAGGNPQANRRV